MLLLLLVAAAGTADACDWPHLTRRERTEVWICEPSRPVKGDIIRPAISPQTPLMPPHFQLPADFNAEMSASLWHVSARLDDDEEAG